MIQAETKASGPELAYEVRKVLVADPIAEEGIERLRHCPTVEVTVAPHWTHEELLDHIGEYHGLIVRSRTPVTRDLIEAAQNLLVIGRAGVGVDQIDMETATRRGIVVCNSPHGNTVAAAEHAIALLLALSRNIPQAHQSVQATQWAPSEFVGVEVYDKVLGIIGLGKIGSEVARRAAAFGMRLLACDPYASPEQARRLAVELVSLPELLAEADYVTLHVPLTKATHHLINAESLARMKPGARLINCARGGIVDEEALAQALHEGWLAGAAFDVFEKEPPTDSPLLSAPNVILTPHLGASTQEAQVRVALDVAEQVLEVLQGRPARNAVNVSPISPEALAQLQPYLALTEKIGSLHAQLSEGHPSVVEVRYSGEVAEQPVSLLTSSLLVGLLQRALEEPVNLVNARILAEGRGLHVIESRDNVAEDYASLITVTVKSEEGERAIAGTLFGKRELRIVSLDEYPVDFAPEGRLLFTVHVDRPGIIGAVGTLLGSNGINIAGMYVGRRFVGDRAVMVLSLDNTVPAELIKQIDQFEGILCSRVVEL